MFVNFLCPLQESAVQLHPAVRPSLPPGCCAPLFAQPHPTLHPKPAVVLAPPALQASAVQLHSPARPCPLSFRCLPYPTLYPKIVLCLLTRHLPVQASAVQPHPPVRLSLLQRCYARLWRPLPAAPPPRPSLPTATSSRSAWWQLGLCPLFPGVGVGCEWCVGTAGCEQVGLVC